MRRLTPILATVLLAACTLPAAAAGSAGRASKRQGATVARRAGTPSGSRSHAHRRPESARRRHHSRHRHHRGHVRRHLHKHRSGTPNHAAQAHKGSLAKRSSSREAKAHGQGGAGRIALRQRRRDGGVALRRSGREASSGRPGGHPRHSSARHQGHSSSRHRVSGSSERQAKRASDACQNTQLMPTSSDLGAIRAATLCLVNHERLLHGLRPLKPNGHLQLSAQSHTDSMVEESYFGHYGPAGQTPADRMKASGYIYSSSIGYSIGENIAWGTLRLSTPKAIVEAWMASPGHRENILSPTYRDTGIGVLPALPGADGKGQQGATYTQDFGVIVKG